jgi:hypothetical protein
MDGWQRLRVWGRRLAFVVAAGAAAAGGGCMKGSGNSANATGSIRAAVSFAPSDGVSAVRIDVARGGTVVATQTIPIPSGTPDGGPAADAFFVLAPGTYAVTATAVNADGVANTACMSATATAVVATGQTTEITLALICGGPGNGGIDVVVTAEHAPAITNLTFDPSKFVTVCEPTTITVTASSPDNLALTYSWSVAANPAANTNGAPQPPPGVASALTASGNMATFDTTTAGDYAITVTVTDTNGLSASLTFPVHVLPGNDCAPVLRGPSVTAVQNLFGLQPATSAPAFTDIGPNDPLFAAVQSVAPFLHRQLLCFGCALINKFLPNEPTTRGENTVPIVALLVSRNLITLLSPADADAALAGFADGASVPLPARPAIATALQAGILQPLPGNLIGVDVLQTSADDEAMLARVATMFNLGGTP